MIMVITEVPRVLQDGLYDHTCILSVFCLYARHPIRFHAPKLDSKFGGFIIRVYLRVKG